MALTIDVDTGGTFTDGFFADGDDFRLVKVETTPHDLTVCFRDIIERGASELGLSVEALLRRADSVKFSTTVATNTMIQKNGPKLGLIVTDGHESDLYSNDGGAERLEGLVPTGMIAGVDSEGGVPDPDQVRAAVRRLLTSGARAIVVCLAGASEDPSAERAVKEMILDDYPKHYLGAVPVFISSELCTRPGDVERLNSTVVNAYLHRELARYLYKAEEDLRQSHYRRPLLIVHSTGGAARVAKTTALHTYNSGPVAGFLGSRRMGELYGLENIVSVDMGGTSTDIGVISRGNFDYELRPSVGGIAVNVPMIGINAIGGGGGSIAKVAPGGSSVEVGPESAGALPGPACYGLGGAEPTVTDADLVLGFLDPARFLGGRRTLEPERAAKAIREKIAEPLGVGLEEAAALVKGRVDEMVRLAIEEDIEGRGLDPGDFAMFVYGGAGSTHCCGFGSGFGSLYTFPSSAVFSAFGASTLDVTHVYEKVLSIELADGAGGYASDLERFNDAVAQMRAAAMRDLRGEGFGLDSAELTLDIEVDWSSSTGRSLMVRSPGLEIDSGRAVREVCSEAEAEISRRAPGEASGGHPIRARALRLTARSPVEHVSFVEHSPVGEDPRAALRGEREVYWDGRFVSTPVYDRDLLECGNIVVGPAVIERDDTTCVLPEGRKMTVDRYLSGIIENA
ncbi:MAG: hydantoinase/oxoprolinase family protein [Actinobacteria bacterium]|nr:hydantoinase/oxoprolinase family protein [Actinomycetota bacterium]MBU1945088.1 hydantoinase/oxoprolinase family protein [Actinomycetota bacterium]MBU2688357.1 hydantoinase/oxoprolinase family protein [Actinomycetota bacterium]